MQNDGKSDERLGVRVGTWNVGSMSGRGTEVCEELRKRRMCCLQEVRWRGQGVWFICVNGRRYKLWWPGNSDGMGGVGVLMKEELSEKVVEVRRKSDKVMTVMMALKEEVVRIICVYGLQSGRTGAEKERFYDDFRSEWDLHSMGEHAMKIVVVKVDEMQFSFMPGKGTIDAVFNMRRLQDNI